MIFFAFVNIKSEKSFFDLEKNDEHKNFDNDESNANNESSANANANANNLFDDMNEDENQTDFAKNSQKKKTRWRKLLATNRRNLIWRTTEKNFLIFNWKFQLVILISQIFLEIFFLISAIISLFVFASFSFWHRTFVEASKHSLYSFFLFTRYIHLNNQFILFDKILCF